MKIRVTWTTPTHPRKKLTAASLACVSQAYISPGNSGAVQNVAGLDDQAPAGPDGSGGHQSGVLGKRELLSWAVKIGDTGDDQSPLSENPVSNVL